MIECRHCGRKYTEFPKNKYKQIECAGCGGSQFINDSSKPQYGYSIDVERQRLVRYAITGGSCGTHPAFGGFRDFSGYGISREEYDAVISMDSSLLLFEHGAVVGR